MSGEHDGSIEERCARIRGRMQWILSQLEGDPSDVLMEAGLKSGAAGGGAAEKLREQQVSHERELESELERQAARLRKEHDSEMEQLRERMANAQVSEMTVLRAELAAARETARTAAGGTEKAVRVAEGEAARYRGQAEAACKRTELLEACLKEHGPLLSQAAVALPPSDPLAAKLTAAMRAFEAQVPGSAPRAPPRPSSAAAALAASPVPYSAATTPATSRAVVPPAAAAAAVRPPPPKPEPPKPAATPNKYGKQSLDGPTPERAAPPPPKLEPPKPPPPKPAATPPPKPEPPKPEPPKPEPPKPAATPNKYGKQSLDGPTPERAAPPPPKPEPPKPPPPKPAPTPPAAKSAPTPAKPAAANEAVPGSGPGKQPPPHGPCLVPIEFGYTHPGGTKPLDAKNQDTYFSFHVDANNACFGVLDGHGSDNGTLIAQVCSDVIEQYVRDNFNRLRTEPEAVFNVAFEKAHEASRKALLATDENLKLVGDPPEKVPVDEWDEDGELQMEAVDGGTTATIIALLDGATLVHAQVGDSSALLGGVIGGEDGGEGEVAFEELMEEHAATNVKEYERVHEQSGSRGRKLRFVYDVQVGAPHSRQTPSGRPLSALWTFSERSLSAL